MAQYLENTNQILSTGLSPGVITCRYKDADKIKTFFFNFIWKLQNTNRTYVFLNFVCLFFKINIPGKFPGNLFQLIPMLRVSSQVRFYCSALKLVSSRSA